MSFPPRSDKPGLHRSNDVGIFLEHRLQLSDVIKHDIHRRILLADVFAVRESRNALHPRLRTVIKSFLMSASSASLNGLSLKDFR